MLIKMYQTNRLYIALDENNCVAPCRRNPELQQLWGTIEGFDKIITNEALIWLSYGTILFAEELADAELLWESEFPDPN